MQGQLDTLACEQLDPDTWETTCALLHHDPTMMKSEPIVAVPGFVRKFLPCQVHSAVRALLMNQTNSVGHCFHGHSMGIGKTSITLIQHRLQHLHNLMHANVAASPGQHLADPPNDAPCPTNTEVFLKYGLDCPCSSKNISSRISPSLGVTIMLAPIPLLQNWAIEWKKCYGLPANQPQRVNEFDEQSMVFIMAHGNASANQGNVLDELKKRIAACDIDFSNKAAHELPNLRPALRNSRVFFVTSAPSFLRQLIQPFEEKIRWTEHFPSVKKMRRGREVEVQPRPENRSTTYYKLVVATLGRDEAHQDRLPTSYTMQVLNGKFLALPQNKHVHLNILSGTLITTGPSDISGYIEAMARLSRDKWQKHPVLRNWCNQEAIALGKDWDHRIKIGDVPDTAIAQVINQLKPLVEQTILRFNPMSNFLGQGPVIMLPPNEYKEVPCRHEERWIKLLDEQKAEEDAAYERAEKQRREEYFRRTGSLTHYLPRKSEGITLHYRARLYASFPFLLEFNKDLGYTLTLKEWKEKRRSGEWNDSHGDIYSQNIDKIADSSAKLKMIERMIAEQDGKLDGEGLHPRMIFCSFFFAGARIIYLVRTSLISCGNSF